MSTPPITSFRGEHEFLSNFHPSPIIWLGRACDTVEHAYQLSKTRDRLRRDQIASARTPGQAKRFGNDRQMTPVRDDWDDVKVDIMRLLLIQKFTVHPVLWQKLMLTRDAELVEGNTWGDTFWGMCQGEGENTLGLLLMDARDALGMIT